MIHHIFSKYKHTHKHTYVLTQARVRTNRNKDSFKKCYVSIKYKYDNKSAPIGAWEVKFEIIMTDQLNSGPSDRPNDGHEKS